MASHSGEAGKLIKGQNGKEFSPKFFETESSMGSFQRIIHIITSILEALLSVVLVCGILFSAIHIPGYFKAIIIDSTVGLKDLINYVALVIIVIELIHVLNLQNLKSVIEILMIAFTRELVIREWAMWQLLIGVFCIAGLFATSKYLMVKDRDKD